MAKKKKIGQPPKLKRDIKNYHSVRFDKGQEDTIKLYDKEKRIQAGLNHLVQWAQENHDLLENIPLLEK